MKTGGPYRPDVIEVVGAATHNLRNVDLSIPKHKIVAFTGVSGSGKTSLAVDTVHAEAQMRYLDGLSPFFRQFIPFKDRPKVERISGLGVTLAVDQRRLNRSPSSTLGTLTGLDDFFALLFARLPALGPQARTDPRLRELSGAHFDRHSPEGRCRVCQGTGGRLRAAADLIITRPDLPLLRGAGAWFERPHTPEHVAIPSLAEHYGADLDLPWRDLPEDFRRAVLYGTGDEPIAIKVTKRHKNGSGEVTFERNEPFRGALAEVERLSQAAGSDGEQGRYAPFVRREDCSECHGSGFGEMARTVRIAGVSFPEVLSETVEELCAWVGRIGPELSPAQRELADTLVPELARRLRLLDRLGLGHLHLSRSAPSMSAGELQRVRVASQLNMDLTGVIFVLDEPAAGLHPVDKEPLREILVGLRDAGNTVLLVEHDPQLIRMADWVVDLGPGAGRDGGRLVATGTPADIARNQESVTGRYLNGAAARVRRRTRRPDPGDGNWLRLVEVAVHNVRVAEARIPLNALTCITGVSGSGKSSLLHDALGAGVEAVLNGRKPAAVAAIEGCGSLDWSMVVDQEPIGRTPRSNPATYTKAFDAIRRLYAATPQAKARRLGVGAFSFNSPGGRCEECAGHGRKQVDLRFMPDLWVVCEACSGRRFTDDVLAVTYRGLAIDEVLALTVDEAKEFFTEPAGLLSVLAAMQRAGLGYLQLGQSATELSGGEAQRLKLANAILRGTSGRGHGLVILDEPVTGLHPSDVQNMVDAFDTLLRTGNTVVIAEHDLRVAACADWLIDMGPGGGHKGGRIVGEGTPADVAAGTGVTARYLRPLVGG